MTRDNATSKVISASQASIVRPVLFVNLFLDSGPIYIHSGIGTITWGGNAYDGVGDFGAVSQIPEDSDLQIPNLSLSLSGIPSDYYQEALSQNYQGRKVQLYLGFLNESFALIDTPVLEFEGEIDTMEFEEGDTAKVKLTVINELHRWETPNVARYTDADQQAKFPGDLGLSMVASVEREAIWGGTRN